MKKLKRFGAFVLSGAMVATTAFAGNGFSTKLQEAHADDAWTYQHAELDSNVDNSVVPENTTWSFTQGVYAAADVVPVGATVVNATGAMGSIGGNRVILVDTPFAATNNTAYVANLAGINRSNVDSQPYIFQKDSYLAPTMADYEKNMYMIGYQTDPDHPDVGYIGYGTYGESFSTYTANGDVAYCLQLDRGTPNGQTLTGHNATGEGYNGELSAATKEKVERVIENGYPLSQDYWSTKGLSAEAQRIATQMAVWSVVPDGEGSGDNYVRRGVESGLWINGKLNGVEQDIIGMTRELISIGENGGSVFEYGAYVTPAGVSLSGSNYVASFKVSSTSNSGYVYKVSEIPGATVQYNGGEATPDASAGWYRAASGAEATITVTVPTTTTGSIRLQAMPADRRTPGSMWFAENVNQSDQKGTIKKSQDMLVIHSIPYVADEICAAATQDLPTAQATLTKRDASGSATAQGDATFAGAVYGIYLAADDSEVAQVTTDANGVATVTGLAAGVEYYAMELTAPTGYELDQTHFPFVADTQQSQTLYVGTADPTDPVLAQPITLHKVDKDDNEVKVEGAGFTFYLVSGILAANGLSELPVNEEGIMVDGLTMPAPAAGEIKTDVNGDLTTGRLPYGTYLAVETTTPAGYRTVAPFTIEVAKDITAATDLAVESTVEEEPYKAVLKIVKVDSESGETIAKADTAFSLYDEEENLITITTADADGEVKEVSVFKTDDNGEVSLLKPLAIGTYFLKEITAPIGYVTPNEMVKVVIAKDAVTAYADTDDAYLATIDTTYDTDTQEHTSTAEVLINNQPIKITVKKTDIVEGEGAHELDGATLRITVRETIYDNDGSVWKEAGEVVDEWVSSSTEPHVMQRIPAGKYTLTEVTAPFGYSVAEDADFEVLDSGEMQMVIMADAPAYGVLTVNKYAAKPAVADADEETEDPAQVEETEEEGPVDAPAEPDLEKPLAGAEYTLYYAEDVLDVEGAVVHAAGDTAIDKDGNPVVLTTDETGVATFGNIPIGTYNGDGSFATEIHYYMQETKAPETYVLDGTQFPVVFTWSEEQSNDIPFVQVATDKQQLGRIGVVKTGLALNEYEEKSTDFGKAHEAKYELRKLEGIVFGVYADADCNEKLFDITTDQDGVAWSDYVALGIYFVREDQAPAQYALDGEVFEVTLTGDETGNEYIVDTTRDLVNHPVGVKVNVHKVGAVFDAASGYKEAQIPLANVTFGIYTKSDIKNEQGEVILKADELMDVIVTGEDGVATLEATLPSGDYYYQELATVEGFVLDDSKYDFTVDCQNEVLKEIDANEKESPLVNTIAEGKLVVTKTNEDGSKKLAGAEFTLKNTVTGEKYVATSDKNGIATFTEMPIGTMKDGQFSYYEYTLKETKAPEGYVVDGKTYTLVFEQKEAGAAVIELKTTIADKPQTPFEQVLGIQSDRQWAMYIMGMALVLGAAMAGVFYKKRDKN